MSRTRLLAVSSDRDVCASPNKLVCSYRNFDVHFSAVCVCMCVSPYMPLAVRAHFVFVSSVFVFLSLLPRCVALPVCARTVREEDVSGGGVPHLPSSSSNAPLSLSLQSARCFCTSFSVGFRQLDTRIEREGKAHTPLCAAVLRLLSGFDFLLMRWCVSLCREGEGSTVSTMARCLPCLRLFLPCGMKCVTGGVDLNPRVSPAAPLWHFMRCMPLRLHRERRFGHPCPPLPYSSAFLTLSAYICRLPLPRADLSQPSLPFRTLGAHKGGTHTHTHTPARYSLSLFVSFHTSAEIEERKRQTHSFTYFPALAT